ncbi:MAG TPA: STAS domain-containing protein [Candidatus Saccharimonadales bacterium]|nr:STAS domain-containing protein [Candidatus Saccharimonadales bacterium]
MTEFGENFEDSPLRSTGPNESIALTESREDSELFISVEPDRTTFMVYGALNLESAQTLSHYLDRFHLYSQPGDSLELEACALTFVDSRTVKLLLDTTNLCKSMGVDFSVRNLDPTLKRTLEICGVTDQLNLKFDALPEG